MSDTSLNESHPLFKAMRTGVYHCTSVAAFRKIRLTGSLKPNNGELPDTWGNHNSKENPCRCRELNAISLLDFESAPLKEIFDPPIFVKKLKSLSVLIRVHPWLK
jgi:hypothetical protein